jgi:hypothetical protein
MPADQAEIERVDQLLPSRHLARLVMLVAPREVDGPDYQPCALSAPSLQLSRDRADKPNERSSELTSLLLEIPPAKPIRLLPLIETSEYQGREPHLVEPWLCRPTRARSSEFDQLLPSRRLARLVGLLPLVKSMGYGYHPCALSAPSLQLSRDRADKLISRSS